MDLHRVARCLLVIFVATTGVAAQQTTPQSPQATPVPSQQGQSSADVELPDAPSTAHNKVQPSTDPRSATAARTVLVATAPYTPLTRDQKFHRWLNYTHSPYTFTSVLFSATYSQMVGDWPTYGGGMQGYGKRLGATLADTEAAGFFKVFLLPTVLHQDPRYFFSGKKGLVPRGWYAATRVLVTRDDDGDNTFNTSEVLGTLFTKSVANAYYPRRDRGLGVTMSGTFGSLISDGGSNILREFWPDISRVFHRHEPEKLKKMEQKIPKPISKAAIGTDEDQ